MRKPATLKPTPEIDLSRIPYPARVANQKHAKEYGHFLDIFKQLKINLPFIEALRRIPKYAKFLKDLLKGKDRLGKLTEVPLSRDCSAVITNTLPEKLTDPGILTIPCLFGSDVRSHALADSGASINLIPYSLYKKLALGDLVPTRMTLSLADRSVKCPRGILENVLVKVDKFVFPVDFVVMDMEADTTVPIILGRPFLRTAKAVIDVFDGKLTLRVGDETVTFVVTKSISKGGIGEGVDKPKCGDVEKKPEVMRSLVDGEMWDAFESGSFLSEWENFPNVSGWFGVLGCRNLAKAWKIWKLSGKLTPSRHARAICPSVALRKGSRSKPVNFLSCTAKGFVFSVAIRDRS
ncbi:hypothetical protein E3N88_00036 [Mikania micrantha]|uniref:Aspartic peptidase DDI1-type domain-containing protein n=1 Tax=Mikania micrantha TaxID=192012 RepID=A0A5N6PZP4_9ASTR|nr:hypothetical protein E3N88_00036 [Mikania micrantha]